MNKLDLFRVSVGAEIGCGDWRSCEIKDYSVDNIYLFEPNILFYQDIVKNTINDGRIKSFNCAISDKDYIGQFYNYGYTSFLKGSDSFVNLWSWDALGKNPPSDPEIYYKDLTSNVIVLNSAQLDKNINFLVLTCNGCEYKVLQNLEFRPKYIQVKYYLHTTKQMAYFNLISSWMGQNKYKPNVLEQARYNTYFNLIFIKQ